MGSGCRGLGLAYIVLNLQRLKLLNPRCRARELGTEEDNRVKLRVLTKHTHVYLGADAFPEGTLTTLGSTLSYQPFNSIMIKQSTAPRAQRRGRNKQ